MLGSVLFAPGARSRTDDFDRSADATATAPPSPATITHQQVLVIYSGLVLAMLSGRSTGVRGSTGPPPVTADLSSGILSRPFARRFA